MVNVLRAGHALAALLFVLASGCSGGSDGGGSAGSARPDTAPPIAPPPPPPAPPPPPPELPQGPAQVTYLHRFGEQAGDGWQPWAPLLLASDGNLYGVTIGGPEGCAHDDVQCGVLFRYTPKGEYRVLHRFGQAVTDPYSPRGTLVEGRDGSLYGVTLSGGAHNLGTVYRITKNGDFRVLHEFGPDRRQGMTPVGSLVEGRDGNFYGATTNGGTSVCFLKPLGCGTLFRVSPAGEHRMLHSFGPEPELGLSPNGHLIEGDDGNFYGMTSGGGDLNCGPFTQGMTRPDTPVRGCGTLFQMSPDGVVTRLHAFGSVQADGALPQGGLIRGPDGAFYGTTYVGGRGKCSQPRGCGTVFRMAPNGVVNVIHEFALPRSDGSMSKFDGSEPAEMLTLGRDGQLYGLTEWGGRIYTESDRTGTIFRMTLNGEIEVLYRFGPFRQAPGYPFGGLVQTSDGAFYGVVWDGHTPGDPFIGPSTLFRMVVE